jgi:hypothetical protein
MTSADSSPFARLRALRSDLDAATPADGSAIAAARTVLTHVGTSVRDAHPDAQRLLTLVWTTPGDTPSRAVRSAPSPSISLIPATSGRNS